MYKVIVLASVLMLLGCGRDANNTNNTTSSEQSQMNKAVTVKKPLESAGKSLQELKQGEHDLQWKQND